MSHSGEHRFPGGDVVRVEFIYSRDCPNVASARENLSQALRLEKLPLVWNEWDQASSDSPAYVTGFGSPTVLIDGRDITDAEPANEAPCCRLYEFPSNARSGVPSVELIRAALKKGTHSWKQSLLGVPGVLLSALPLGACPACWPIYGGVLSASGLGFLLASSYLVPVTALFLSISLFTLFYRAKERYGYGPFVIGLLASVGILCGKLLLASNPLAYSGVTLLLISSLWNSWPQKVAGTRCPKCAPSSTELIQLSASEKSL